MEGDITTVQFDDFKLKPKDLKVDDKNGLVMDFKAQLSKGQHENLLDFMGNNKYFMVKLDDKKEVKMRFGLPTYSEHEKIMKYHLVLVSEDYDNETQKRYGNTHRNDPNKDNMIAFNSAYIEALERKLLEKEIFSKEDLNEVKDQAKENIFSQKFEMGKIDDVDQYDY